MNSVSLVGRITKDPELRKTMSGDSFVSFTIAVDRIGSKDKADFINCVAWNKLADNLAAYKKKGDLIGITGSLNTRTYERDGSRTYITEVHCANIEYISTAKREDEVPF